MRSGNQWITSGCVLLLLCTVAAAPAPGVELVELTADTWDEFAPAGKEVDCIYGDFVLRNESIVAVIARPVATRNANMTVRNVGGMLIDLTLRHAPNDQLSAYYASGMPLLFHDPQTIVVRRGEQAVPMTAGMLVEGDRISWEAATQNADGLQITLRYTLRDRQPYVEVETLIVNPLDKPVSVELSDMIRADRTFEFGNFQVGPDATDNVFWAADDWFGQAYGVMVDGRQIKQGARNALQLLRGDSAQLSLPAGGDHRIARRIFPGSNLLQVRGLANRLAGRIGSPVVFEVTDAAGPVAHAQVRASQDGQKYASGRTNARGLLECEMPAGEYELEIQGLGRPLKQQGLTVAERQPTPALVTLDSCGYVRGEIRDEAGQPIPCKVAFHGMDQAESPDFGPDSAAVGVGNLHYSHNGSFRQEIAPGRYEVLISYGPEYDAVTQQIQVQAGQETPVRATLRRVVDTRGWVSSDFHSHSSPSGDNTSSQLGRVLNLLCEHVEFCPCTEHNRIDTYVPQLEVLGVRHLMATCSGMELTGQPLPVNHQNAFPLHLHPHVQDGGGPHTHENPIVQIERLALWDSGSEKLVQQNHPNLLQILSDRDLDGKADGGFEGMFGFMDVIEVHPPQNIFHKPERDPSGQLSRNPIFHWMQLLNLGYRIPGVVNTDAHYNYHGSGWLRNYLKSSTDDPAQVDVMEMVHASEAGHIIMTTGPFLEVEMHGATAEDAAIPGDDLLAREGRASLSIRVQCSNWLDINRVQVFLNGRPHPDLNFTRRSAPDRFGNGVVKFEQTLPLELERDTHVIVAAIGEELQLGRVMGPQRGTTPPVAVSNPVFVDVDGNGFESNGDLLDLPLPEGAAAR